MTVNLSGRTDLEEYFKYSGVLREGKERHTPFLVFVTRDDNVTIEIVDRLSELLNYPDDTPVMAQWRGQWSSDFFKYTVGDVRQQMEMVTA